MVLIIERQYFYSYFWKYALLLLVIRKVETTWYKHRFYFQENSLSDFISLFSVTFIRWVVSLTLVTDMFIVATWTIWTCSQILTHTIKSITRFVRLSVRFSVETTPATTTKWFAAAPSPERARIVVLLPGVIWMFILIIVGLSWNLGNGRTVGGSLLNFEQSKLPRSSQCNTCVLYHHNPKLWQYQNLFWYSRR